VKRTSYEAPYYAVLWYRQSTFKGRQKIQRNGVFYGNSGIWNSSTHLLLLLGLIYNNWAWEIRLGASPDYV